MNEDKKQPPTEGELGNDDLEQVAGGTPLSANTPIDKIKPAPTGPKPFTMESSGTWLKEGK